MTNSEYKKLFDKAAKLLNGRINLDWKPLPNPGFFERLRLRRALAAFEKAAAADPQNGAPLLFLGKIEERLGHQGKCTEWLRKANKAEPNNLIVVLELGAALGRQGLYSESVAVLGTTARDHPDDPRIHCNLALSLLMAGDPNRAIHEFKHVLMLEPEVAVNKKLLEYAIAVSQGRKSIPKSESEIARSL